MKKSFLLLSTSLLLAGSIGGSKVFAANANEPTVGEEIQTLIADFLNSGYYTKKTTIGLNDASVQDLNACFHCGQNALKRTTYYKPGQLLLAAEDGTIPEGSGSYVYVAADHEVKRSAALAGSTEDNMWDNLSEPVSVGQTEANGLENYYITLNTFMSAGYFDGWGKNGDVYYYDLSNEEKQKKEGTDIYNCDIWNEFLYFCAPMLYQNSGYYFSAKSLTITTKYDNNAEKYLCLDMYLEDWEKEGKLSQDYLTEARIYKGNKVFAECLDKAFYLVSGDDKIKFNADPDNNTHIMINNVSMSKGTAVKVWDTNGNYYGSTRGMEHNLSIGVNKDTGLVDDSDNYVIPEDGKYDFYVDFNNDGSYKKLYVNDKNAMTLYIDSGNWADIDSKKLWCRYYDKDSNELTSDWHKPNAVYSHDNSNGYCVCKIVVPSEAKYLQICYNKADWAGGTYVVTGLQEIKYPEYNTFRFDQWNDNYSLITFAYANI